MVGEVRENGANEAWSEGNCDFLGPNLEELRYPVQGCRLLNLII